ncbi:MAG: hypothetical protein GQ574_19675 [Crocinitomix sp.]|nr:hypothetical protein [Crocinitomix sp.]
MNRYIKSYNQAIEEKLCKELINFFENNHDNHFWGMIQQNTINLKKKKVRELVLVPDNDVSYNLLLNLQKSLIIYLKKYQDKNEMINIPLIPTQFRIKKYDSDGESKFDWHIDASQISRSKRMLVAIWYLNTVNVGGETEFEGPNCKIKPAQGKIALFPPFWTFKHRGNPPISNPKYTVSTFLEMAH